MGGQEWEGKHNKSSPSVCLFSAKRYDGADFVPAREGTGPGRNNRKAGR